MEIVALAIVLGACAIGYFGYQAWRTWVRYLQDRDFVNKMNDKR